MAGKRQMSARAIVLSISAVLGLASGLLVGGIQTSSTVEIVIAVAVYLLGICALVALVPTIRRRRQQSSR